VWQVGLADHCCVRSQICSVAAIVVVCQNICRANREQSGLFLKFTTPQLQNSNDSSLGFVDIITYIREHRHVSDGER